jgi:hypothetical protein
VVGRQAMLKDHSHDLLNDSIIGSGGGSVPEQVLNDKRIDIQQGREGRATH